MVVEWERGRTWSCSRGGFTTGGADTPEEMYSMIFLIKPTLMLDWAGLVSVWQSLGMGGLVSVWQSLGMVGLVSLWQSPGMAGTAGGLS